jgi:hypothetical protein
MRPFIGITLMMFTTAAYASWFGECDHKARRNTQIDTNGVTRVVILAKAGWLRVEGRDGVRTITATGEACASDETALREIALVASRSGSVVTVEAKIPEVSRSFFLGSGSAALDFNVNLPPTLPVEIHDTSGSMEVANVGTAWIDDSSGDIEVRRVRGDLTIRDTSGGIYVEDVAGSVHIPSDSSGSIDIRRVGADVVIDDDSSGAVTIRNVKRNVVIGDKGSGSIFVSDVGGNFTVREKGSGHIDYERVAGKVSVPRR